jgi:hypothetical protein
MTRLSRRSRPLTFDDLIRTDEYHDIFLNRDVPALSDEEIWADRKLREVELADLIRRRDGSVIGGSDILTNRPAPLTRAEWVRGRLQALQAESRQRTRRQAS